jgi:hypothetical protein
VLATLPIPILLALLAQAEPAPADVQPEAEAVPVPTAEAAAGAEPAPVPEPPPAPLAPAQPEPKQEQAGRSVAEPRMMFGFRAGVDFQLSGDVSPKTGYSLTPFFQYDYARLGDRLSFGVRAEFTFDRFQKLVTAQALVDGVEQSYRTTRSLTYFDFALLATATLHLGRLQPWAAAGMGLALGNFDSPEAAYQPGDFRITSPLVIGAGGLDVAVGRGLLVGLHVEYRGMLAKPSSALASGQTINVFGDRLSVQAGLLYQF